MGRDCSMVGMENSLNDLMYGISYTEFHICMIFGRREISKLEITNNMKSATALLEGGSVIFT